MPEMIPDTDLSQNNYQAEQAELTEPTLEIKIPETEFDYKNERITNLGAESTEHKHQNMT
jgi:hypothetical protein